MFTYSKCSLPSPAPGIHRGVPAYFRGWCHTASRGEHGGYRAVGRSLVEVLPREAPHDLEDDEWFVELGALAQHLEDSNDESAWRWLKSKLPRMMELIPPRHKWKFMAGVRESYCESGFES